MSNDKDIELRSEKVRNVIGQIPSSLTRIGSTIIFLAMIGLLIGAYFFKFDHTIEATASLYMDADNSVYYDIKIPYNKINQIKSGQKIVMFINNENSFTNTVQNIDSAMHICENQIYFQVKGICDNVDFYIDTSIDIKAVIYTGKINAINYILNNN